jgi:hypothetical protein
VPKSSATRLAFFTALTLGIALPAAAQRCVPVSGRIVNNFSSAESTLGVVAMVYGTGKSELKLKCGLSGTATSGDYAINFVHQISCDDTIPVALQDGSGNVPVHSSIVLYTTGSVGAPQQPTQLFSFNEVSVPITTAPARGLFAGVSGGQILVEGAVYKAPDGVSPGSIDMKFAGQVCYPQ